MAPGEPPSIAPLSAEQGRVLHRRLLDGDPVAPSDLAVEYLDGLAEWLLERNPSIEPHLCETAAADAILALAKNPASYRPEHSSLTSYLRMSAFGDLKNLLAKECRHRGSETVVELSALDGKYVRDDASDPARLAEEHEEARRIARLRNDVIPREVQAGLTAEEREVLELMMDGERKTEPYARALRIVHLPADQQRRDVKRVKDRLMKRIRRAGARRE